MSRSPIRGFRRIPTRWRDFAYIHVILQASFPGALPPWFSRGVAAVLSNTIVQEDTLVVGAPILNHVTLLRSHPPMPLRTLLAMSADDPVLKQEDRLIAFDASAWSFVHFLLFAETPLAARVSTRWQFSCRKAPGPLPQSSSPSERSRSSRTSTVDMWVEAFSNIRRAASMRPSNAKRSQWVGWRPPRSPRCAAPSTR